MKIPLIYFGSQYHSTVQIYIFSLLRYPQHISISQYIQCLDFLGKLLIKYEFSKQILALPLGVQLGKVFWCNPGTNVMNVANEIQCWSSEHIVYVVISLVVLLLVFPLYALKLYLQIKSQVSRHLVLQFFTYELIG